MLKFDFQSFFTRYLIKQQVAILTSPYQYAGNIVECLTCYLKVNNSEQYKKFLIPIETTREDWYERQI